MYKIHKNVWNILYKLPIDILVQDVIIISQGQTKQTDNIIISKEVVIMCIMKSELEEKVAEIRRYKAIVEEATSIQRSIEAEVIAYMVENNLDTEITDTAKITYKSQTRTSLNKESLSELLGDLKPFEKKTSYHVLRIS